MGQKMAQEHEWKVYELGSEMVSTKIHKNEVNHQIPYSIRWTGKARMQLSILSPHKLYKPRMLGAEQRYLHESQGDKREVLCVSMEVCGGRKLELTKDGQRQNTVVAYSVVVTRSTCWLVPMLPPVRLLHVKLGMALGSI